MLKLALLNQLPIIKLITVRHERLSSSVTIIYGIEEVSSDINRLYDLLGGSDILGSELVQQQLRDRLSIRRKSNAETDSKRLVLSELGRAFKIQIDVTKKLGQSSLTMTIPYFTHEHGDYDFAVNTLGDYLETLGYQPQIEDNLEVNNEN